jgi:S1-C subfamily serine protease
VHVSTLTTMQRRMFTAPYASSGSGWIWDADGHIVTNAHVVESSERVQVQLFDGELRDAEVVGLDLRADVAVLKVAAGGLHPSLRGDSGKLEQGDMVFAFGSPFDFRFSMSSGIVSGLQRSAGLADIAAPTLVMVGSDDVLTPLDAGPAGVGARDVAAMIPRGELRVFEGSGHGHYVEQADESVDAIIDFLHRH